MKKDNDFFETCKKIWEKIVNVFTTKSSSEIFQFVVEIVLILIFILVLRIPFALINEIGDKIFELSMYSYVGEFIELIWHLFVELIYLLTSIIVFVNIFKVRYLNDKDNKKKTKEEKTKKEAKKVVKQNNKSIFSLIFKIILALIAIFIVICIIVNCTFLGLIIFIGVKYNWFIGLFLIFLSLFFTNFWLLNIIIKIIAEKALKLKSIIISLILIIIIFVIGIIVNGIKFSKLEIKEANIINSKIKEEKIKLSNLYRTDIEIDTDNVIYNIEYDNKLNNEALIKIEYDENCFNYEIIKRYEGKYEIIEKVAILDILDEFLESLKNDELLTYSNNANKITVYVNQKDLFKLDLED